MGLDRKTVVSTGVEILVNFVLPYILYVEMEARLGAAHALMAASLPPVVWSLIEFARKRRVDALSLMVIAGIVLSLLAFLGGGSVRFLQLRENLVTGLIGLVFLGSAAIGRPLIFQLARASMLRKSQLEAENFEQLRVHRQFRRSMTVMTLVWGFGLVVQTAIACVLVFQMTIRNYLIASPFLGYGTMGALALWTFLYAKRMKRRGEAAWRAAEASGSTDRANLMRAEAP
jgi:intracellular septation protein A